MTVLINMEIPDSCRECMFCKFDSCTGSTECVIDDCVLAKYFKTIEFEGRAEECPLKEVVTCGECKHRDPEDKQCDCGHDIKWQLPRKDTWFCADAESKRGE